MDRDGGPADAPASVFPGADLGQATFQFCFGRNTEPAINQAAGSQVFQALQARRSFRLILMIEFGM
jgi:hypothetical protein